LQIEVDQSGKTEKMNIDTVLAFSNRKSAAVLIPAEAKRVCLRAMRRRGRPKMTIVLRIFAAGLFLLLQDVLEEVTLVTIDEEYPGREGDIKGILLRLIWASGKGFDKERIVFHQVGKKSAAHFKAYGVYKGFRKADRILTAEDILALIQ
jgi:hypothetical protein